MPVATWNREWYHTQAGGSEMRSADKRREEIERNPRHVRFEDLGYPTEEQVFAEIGTWTYVSGAAAPATSVSAREVAPHSACPPAAAAALRRAGGPGGAQGD